MRWRKTVLYGRLVRNLRYRFSRANNNAELVPNPRTSAATPAFPPDISKHPAPDSIRTMEKCIEAIRGLRSDHKVIKLLSRQVGHSVDTQESRLDHFENRLALFDEKQAKMERDIAKRTSNYKNLVSALDDFEKKLDIKFELMAGDVEKSNLDGAQKINVQNLQMGRNFHSHGKKLDSFHNQLYICEMRMGVAEAKLIAYEGRMIYGENRLCAIEQWMRSYEGRVNRIDDAAQATSATLTMVLQRLAALEQNQFLVNGNN